MNLKKIQDADVEGKKVLLRVDFNVSVEAGTVKEKFRIESARETIDYLLGMNAKVALLSHFGRPEGKNNSDFSLNPMKDDIEYITGHKVKFINDCLRKDIRDILNGLDEGEMILLENVRFYEGEEKNDEQFAKSLAENYDIYINEAFSVSHRDQASVTAITKFLPSYAGLRFQEEIERMDKIKNDFYRPAVAIIGGAKIETKLPVIKFFEANYDHVLVAGKIANEVLDQNLDFSDKVILPVDWIDDRLDIGPKTIDNFKEIISASKTVVWNGPTGKFEEEKYAVSSNEILQTVLSAREANGAYVVIGGGETLEILEKNKAMKKVDFVSTGGGAMLSYLGGEKMPGIDILRE